MPAALGLGVLPWSPLKMGALSAKQFDIIDAVNRVAGELGAEASAVALAWLQAKPGVTSTIIGARTLEHHEGNLKALELRLSADQVARLDAASAPVLNFPSAFNQRSPNFMHVGATVNGHATTLFANVPKDGERRW